MEEKPRFATGIDIGTSYIRTVICSVKRDEKGLDKYAVIGYSEVPSEGLRRGSIKDINLPARAIDDCLAKAEPMCGYDVHDATVSINSTSIISTKIDGMITIDNTGHEIDFDDIERLDGVSVSGKVPANRHNLEVVPYEYILDGQGGIKEPIGMQGSRLELRANVISTMKPDYDILIKTCQKTDLAVNCAIPSVIAAARAVLTPKQRENGVGVVDFGGATTSVAIFDEGELQFVAVIPIGSNDITRDLATVLMTVPDVAEEIKLRYTTGRFDDGKDISIKRGHDEYVFSRSEINEVVEARLEEIFENVRKILKHAGYDRRLPEGLVLVGGGARMRDIDVYARTQVELAVRVGKIEGIESVKSEVLRPEFATAIGLALIDAETANSPNMGRVEKKRRKFNGKNFFSSVLSKFK